MPNKHLRNMLIAFFSSSFLFAVFIFSALLFLPGQIRGIDIYGGVKANSIGILGYSLIVCATCVSGLIFLGIKNRFVKGFLFLLLILYLALLILMDSMSGWIILIIATLAGSYFKHRGMNKSVFAIPRLYLAVIIFSIFLLFIDAKIFAVHLPNVGNFKESAFIFKIHGEELGFKESLNIAVASFRDNWLLGSGQSTFLYNFSKHAKGLSAERLSNPYRFSSFNGGYNYFFDIFTNLGLLGASSFLGLVVIFFATVVYIIKSEEEDAKRNIIYFIFISSIAAVLIQLFINDNITILFLFWIFLAFMMVVLKSFFPYIFNETSFTKEDGSGNGFNFFFLFEFIAVLFVICVSIIGIKAGRYRLAETKYKEYLIQGADEYGRIKQAAELNPHSENYLNGLADISLNKIKGELTKEDQDLGIIREEATKGIETVKRNTLEHSNSAAVWEKQGDLYMTVFPFVKKGASSWAIRSFERAMELEPNNPHLILKLGKAYFLEGTEDGMDILKVDKAIGYFEQIMNSCREDDLFNFDKNDMVCLDNNDEARVYLSKALEAKGDQQKAIGELEKAQEDEIDEEVMFELGRLYFNNNQLEKATAILKRVVEISPNYANALYALGAAYEKMGKADAAFELYNRVYELNPKIEDVKEKIEGLNKN